MKDKIKFNIEELKKKTDEELVRIIYEKASELHFGTYGESLDSFNPAMKELYATIVLHDEVRHSGLEQFYINNGIQWAKVAFKGLERISAEELTAVIEKSIQLFSDKSDKYMRQRAREIHRLERTFSEFKGLTDLQVKYVRSNYKLFLPN